VEFLGLMAVTIKMTMQKIAKQKWADQQSVEG